MSRRVELGSLPLRQVAALCRRRHHDERMVGPAGGAVGEGAMDGLGGHVGPQRFAGLRTPRWRDRLLAALAERADAQGRIRMSFELVYGHAYKPAPRPGRGGPVSVSLEAVRATLPGRAR